MAITPAEAVQAAGRGLREIDPDKNADVAAASTGGHAGGPLLVTRLDEPGRDYYLVPWQDQRGILVIIQVDASTGEMSSAAALHTPLPRLVMSPSDACRALETQLNKRVIGQPKLVWQPCRESASPLQPFYHIMTEGGDAFVTVGGSVYRSLTPFGKGG